MATIVNTMEKRVTNSKKQKLIVKVLFKSLLAGSIGYSIFLLTLYLTYSLLFSLFKLGNGHVAELDLLVSTFGFLVFYTTCVIKEMKNNNLVKK